VAALSRVEINVAAAPATIAMEKSRLFIISISLLSRGYVRVMGALSVIVGEAQCQCTPVVS
jgi:hypothetical protein